MEVTHTLSPRDARTRTAVLEPYFVRSTGSTESTEDYERSTKSTEYCIFFEYEEY